MRRRRPAPIQLLWLAPLSLLLAAAAEPDPGPRFGLDCRGLEIRRDGEGAPITLPYAAKLSLDLAARRFCVESCTAARSYPIVDPIARPIRLIDSRIPTQRREMLFDPATMRLTDEQRFAVASLPPLERRISATCTVAAFRAPSGPGTE